MRDTYLLVAIEFAGSATGLAFFENLEHAYLHVIVEDLTAGPSLIDEFLEHSLATVSEKCF